MVNPEFLRRLGLFIIEEFLPPELCAELRGIARRTPVTKAMVAGAGNIFVDEEMRKTYDVQMSAATKSEIYAMLLSRKRELESHFGVALSDCQQPAFLSYEAGNFFHRHQDNTYAADLPEFIHRRKVSVVVFLNDHCHEDRAETFSGGELTFYGLLNDSRLADKGIPLKCREGLLIAFRSDVKHEVRPVTRGERYTIVTWFY